MHNSKSSVDAVTRKHMNFFLFFFKCDRDPIFQVANLNRNLTQFRPLGIHYQPDLTERNGSLDM